MTEECKGSIISLSYSSRGLFAKTNIFLCGGLVWDGGGGMDRMEHSWSVFANSSRWRDEHFFPQPPVIFSFCLQVVAGD